MYSDQVSLPAPILAQEPPYGLMPPPAEYAYSVLLTAQLLLMYKSKSTLLGHEESKRCPT